METLVPDDYIMYRHNAQSNLAAPQFTRVRYSTDDDNVITEALAGTNIEV